MLQKIPGIILLWQLACLGLGNAQEALPPNMIPANPSEIPYQGKTVPNEPIEESPPTTPTQSPMKKDLMGSIGGGPGGLGGPGPGYSLMWLPASSILGSNKDIGLFRQSLSLGMPVYHQGGDMVMLTASVRNTHFSTDATLPDTGRAFPKDLWNVNFGINYFHKFNNGWSSGLMFNFGSASDKPFQSIREMTLGGLAFLKIPVRNERDAWMFSLMYSPVGNLNFPIPGIAYSWNPSDSLHVNIGVPFFVMWKPMEDLTLTASYFPLTNINAKANYQLTKGFNIYTGYEFFNESYLLSDRVNSRDRFMGFEQKVVGGLRWNFWKSASLDLTSGYVFSRYFAEGRNQGATLHDRIDIAPGALFGANLGMKF